MRNRFLIVFSILAASLALAGCGSFSLAGDVTPPPGAPNQAGPQPLPTQPPAQSNVVFPLLPPDPGSGQAIYAQKCLPCHGPSGNGDGPQAGGLPVTPAAIGSPDIARASRPADWFNVISQGNIDRYMPGFQASLTDRQRWDVLAYVYTLSTTKDQVDQGKQIYTSQCVVCHGASGKGDGPNGFGLNTPDWSQQDRLAGLSSQELVALLANGKNKMPAFVQTLSVDQRWAVINYVRSLTYQSGGAEIAAATPAANQTPAALSTTNPATPAVSQRTATIRGKILDSKGQPTKPGLKVDLSTFQGMTQAAQISTTSGADGTYEFKDVTFTTDEAFVVQVEANQYTFNSNILQAKDVSGASADLPVTIYDISSDASSLSADRMHVFFDFSKSGVVQVVELFIISNPTDKLIVPAAAQKPVLSFALPKNATNLQFENGAIGDRFVQTAQGFGDLSPVSPGSGQHQVLFSYELPYDQNLSLSLPLTINVGAAMVMVPTGGVGLSSTQLASSGTRDAQGVTFDLYTGSNLTAGSTLNMDLAGKIQSAQSPQATGNTTGLVIGVSAFGLALVVFVLWILWKRKQMVSVQAASMPESAVEIDDEEALLDAILTLEDKYQAGELTEDAFTLRRAELKEHLLQIRKGKVN